MRNLRLKTLLSKHFFTSDQDSSSATIIGNEVGTSTTTVVFGKRNRTPTVLIVDVKTPMEPLKSSRVTNFDRRNCLRINHSRSTISVSKDQASQGPTERKMGQEVQAKNGNGKPVYHIILGTELCVSKGP